MASAPWINQWNEKWRASPQYATILRSVGVDPSQRFTLSDAQRKQVQRAIEMQGMKLPGGVEIDPAGNLNENEGFGKQAKRWGPIVGGAAVGMFGVPGLFPGLLNAGGAGAAAGSAAQGAAGTLPSYGPSAAMQAANMSMGPIGGALSGSGALGTLAATGGAAAGGGLAKNLIGKLGSAFSDPKSLAAIGPMIAALMASRGFGGGVNPQDSARLDQAYADAQRINALKEARFRRVDPLHEMATQLAASRMPTNVQIPFERVPLPKG